MKTLLAILLVFELSGCGRTTLTGGGQDARTDTVPTDAVTTGGATTGGSSAGGAPAGGAGAGGAATGGTGAGGAGGTVARPLWRQSYEPFCPKTSAYPYFADVWSDERGVFVLASDDAGPPAIWTNTGTGWQNSFTWPAGASAAGGGLKGFSGGPLVAYGFSKCTIQFVDETGAHCSGAASQVYDLAIVNRNLAYAVYLDRVLRFDGTWWTQLGGPLPSGETGSARAVWADATTIVIVGNAGNITIIPAGRDPVLQNGLPEVDFTAVWGFGATDIWAGNDLGQLYHYDGAQWSLKATIPEKLESIGILKLWGNDGKLFVIARRLFGTWNGKGITTLDSLDSETQYFEGLWGNSPTEVFVSLMDSEGTTSNCGPLKIRWWNGSVVSPL